MIKHIFLVEKYAKILSGVRGGKPKLIGRKDINMRGLFKKLKKKRCNKCENVFKRSSIFACHKSGIYIEPVKLICFKYRKVEE